MKREGFTLIETLIYAAIFAIAIFALVSVYNSSVQTHSIALAQEAVLESRRVAEAAILKRLREATSVTTPASGTSSTLVIGSPTAAENPVTFAVSSGRLTMKLGSGTAVPLTSSTVTVTSFSVTRLDGVPASLGITIVYSASTAARATVTATSNFGFTLRL
jgi:Tfp pilus assembly protein PilW